MKIDVDKNLLEAARQKLRHKTNEEVVEYALKLLIGINEQSKLKELRGKLKWEGGISEMRENI